jgi:hypothetical protein
MDGWMDDGATSKVPFEGIPSNGRINLDDDARLRRTVKHHQT